MNAESAQKRIAFGYNRGPTNQIEPNVGQANVVKLIFAWYLEGKSLNQIADMLEGIGGSHCTEQTQMGTASVG